MAGLWRLIAGVMRFLAKDFGLLADAAGAESRG